MRHVSHPAGALVGSGDAADAAHELEDNPEPRTTSETSEYQRRARRRIAPEAQTLGTPDSGETAYCENVAAMLASK